MDFAQAAQRWHDFYLLVGTAAATLIGLMFIAISFAVGSKEESTRSDVDAWVTPSLVYFAEVFVISATVLSPVGATAVGVILGGLLLLNLPFGLVRLRYLKTQHSEERIPSTIWLWQMGLPLLAQLVLGFGAMGLLLGDSRALAAGAAAVMVLLVVAVRNTWYLVIYFIEQRQKD